MSRHRCPACYHMFGTKDETNVSVTRAERELRDALRFRRRAYAISVAVATFAVYLMVGTTKAAQAFIVIGASVIVGIVAFFYHDVSSHTVVEAKDQLEDARRRWAESILEEDAS